MCHVPRGPLFQRVLLLMLGVTAAGCANTRVAQLKPEEFAAVREGRAAVVLLRAVDELPGTGRSAAFEPGSAGKAVSLTRLRAPGTLRGVPLRSPGEAALWTGWVYLVLKPGTYYLLVHDPDPAGLAPAAAAPGEDWLLDVPTGSPLVYAGTVVFSHAPPAKPRSAAEHAHAAVATHVRDDSVEALEVGSEYFRGLLAGGGAAVRTMVVRPYSGPVAARAPANGAGTTRPRVVATGAPRARGFEVQGTCVQDGARDGLFYGQPILASEGSGTPADLLFLMVATGLYLWAGTGAIIGSVVGAGEAAKIQPCVAQTVRWVDEYGLAERLSQSLSERLRAAPAGLSAHQDGASRGARAGDERTPVLSVSVQELHLRPCAKAHLACVEAKVRVRLWDPPAGRHEMDRVLLYSNEAARHRTAPYGTPLPPYVLPIDEAPVLNLHALRRKPVAARRKAIDAEMDRAVAVLSRHILADLHGAPAPSGFDASLRRWRHGDGPDTPNARTITSRNASHPERPRDSGSNYDHP